MSHTNGIATQLRVVCSRALAGRAGPEGRDLYIPLHRGLIGAVPYASPRLGASATAGYNPIHNVMREQPVRISHLTKPSAGRQTFNYGSLSKHYANPCMLYRSRAGCTSTRERLHVGGSGEFQPQAHLFQHRSLGFCGRHNPAFYTWAPLRRKGCIFERASCRCLILGRRWSSTSNDNPTH
jgi:hypothetical protein